MPAAPQTSSELVDLIESLITDPLLRQNTAANLRLILLTITASFLNRLEDGTGDGTPPDYAALVAALKGKQNKVAARLKNRYSAGNPKRDLLELEAIIDYLFQESTGSTAPVDGRHRGEFTPNTFYLQYDLVTYKGDAFSATSSFTSGDDFDSAEWLPFAAPVTVQSQHTEILETLLQQALAESQLARLSPITLAAGDGAFVGYATLGDLLAANRYTDGAITLNEPANAEGLELSGDIAALRGEGNALFGNTGRVTLAVGRVSEAELINVDITSRTLFNCRLSQANRIVAGAAVTATDCQIRADTTTVAGTLILAAGTTVDGEFILEPGGQVIDQRGGTGGTGRDLLDLTTDFIQQVMALAYTDCDADPAASPDGSYPGQQFDAKDAQGRNLHFYCARGTYDPTAPAGTTGAGPAWHYTVKLG